MKFRSLFWKLSLSKLAFPILQYRLGKQPNTFFPCCKIKQAKRGRLVWMLTFPTGRLFVYCDAICPD